MRRYDELIDVKPGLVSGEEGPAQFLWRNRLWVVHDVETRWLETGDWWDGPAARAVRGDDGPADRAGTGASEDDLIREAEVWRVVAGAGSSGPRGVCELERAAATGEWRLRTVHD